MLRTATTIFIILLLARIASSQVGIPAGESDPESPEGEFHMVRLIYRTSGGGGSRGIIQPWWAIDYPLAELHFFNALRRLTNITVAEDSIHLEATDKRIFEYPFMFLQQPGRGNWRPTYDDAAQLREYLMRGGFLLVDDFHGEYDWAVFEAAIRKVLPGCSIVEIPKEDNFMHVFFDLDSDYHVPIPGDRHLRIGPGGRTVAQMEGPTEWRGIYDDQGRLMVGINFNIDMGDGWEHADDPGYPSPMTTAAYRLGVNYVIYAMTH